MLKALGYGFKDAIRIVNSASLLYFSECVFDLHGQGGVELSEALSVCCPEPLLHRRIHGRISELRDILMLDANAIYSRDPAARSIEEVVYCYPGFFAIICYRIAHILYTEGISPLCRFVSEYAHSLTGVDIHPGADIGIGFAIDHGTGIVIGETAVVGSHVSIYHGVTLGARDVVTAKDTSCAKRHPTVGDGCIICANATVLGKATVIGAGSVIGAGALVTHSLPPNSVVYNKNGDVK